MDTKQNIAPDYLSDKSKEIFNYFVNETISPAQVALLIRGLEAMELADRCNELIKNESLLQESDGKIGHTNPLIGIQAQATSDFLKVWRLLGLNKSTEMPWPGL